MDRRVLGLDIAILAVWGIGIGLGSWAFLYVGLLLLGVVVWLQGGLRFRRTRAYSRELGAAALQLLKLRRPSNRALRVLAIAAGTLVLIVVLNQLRIAMPGEGRGLSIPTNFDGLNVGFDGFSSAGSAFATILSWTILLSFVAAVWWRLWQPLADRGEARLRIAFLSCLGAFLLAPALFSLAMLAAPEDPKANIAYGKVWARLALTVVALSVTVAIALPLSADRPRPTPATVLAPSAPRPPPPA